MSWELRVGAVQMRSGGDLAANLATCRELAAQAVDQGAKLVVLPECFSFIEGARRHQGDKLAIAEDLAAPGPVLGMLREAATKHGVWMVGGGTPARVPGDAKRTYNTAVVVD